LDQIISEGYYTIGHTSGSAVVMEVGDHQEAILDSKGKLAMFGAGLVHWTTSLSLAGQYIVRELSDNPGIFEDDQFICNDPYTAASHGPDIALVAPIIYENKLIGFAASSSHQMDIGGRDPGGIMVRPEECYEEGILFPAVKIIERGKWRKDLMMYIQSSVRAPVFSIQEISSKIASNNVMKTRVLELCKRYGADTVIQLFEQIQDVSEEMVRAKLRRIPDGTWKAIHYNEGINRQTVPYYRMECTLTKKGDSLIYDMTGTDPQSPQCENSTWAATTGNLLGAYVVMLCHDIPWSSGIHRPIEFVIPEGTIANPRKPAAVSYSTPSGSGYAIEGLGQELMSKMLQTSEEDRKECCGVPGGAIHDAQMGGINHDGTYYTTILMMGIAGGTGGLNDADGDNVGGNMWCPKTKIADAEMNELLYPVLTVFRKEIPDTGGIGKHRGGNALFTALIPWDAGSPLTNVGLSHGFDVRVGNGTQGGYPAPHISMNIIRNSDFREQVKNGQYPRDIDAVKGNREYPYPKGFWKLDENDISCYWCGGGGGYGDPLERDPKNVLKDVLDSEMSTGYARQVYGVVIDSKAKTIDLAGTEKLRKQMLQKRMQKKVTQNGKKYNQARTKARLLEYIDAVETDNEAIYKCRKCGHVLGSTKGDYKDQSSMAEKPITYAEPSFIAPLSKDNPFIIREYSCPACGVMFEVDMVRKDEKQIRSVTLL
jgi:N-methylhydantoinase B